MISFITAFTPKLCMNCKFFKNDFLLRTEFGKCSKFILKPNNDSYLVNGHIINKIDYYYCSTVRKYMECGKEGIFFEKK